MESKKSKESHLVRDVILSGAMTIGIGLLIDAKATLVTTGVGLVLFAGWAISQ